MVIQTLLSPRGQHNTAGPDSASAKATISEDTVQFIRGVAPFQLLWTMMVTKEASMQAYNVRIPCANAYLCLACSVLVDCCSSWKIIIEDCLELALHVKEVHLSVE